MTAQEQFSCLLREHIGPGLRERGFNGTGVTWALPSDTHWVLLGWQKSRGSTAEAVLFTCNLLVLSKAAWDAEKVPQGRVPDKPSPNTFYGVGWQRRLGGLVPGSGGDRWWYVRSGDDLVALASEVITTLDIYGSPAVLERLDAERSLRPSCSHNVGFHNSYRACALPAEIALGGKDRRYFRCNEHAGQMQSAGAHPVLGCWPSLY